MTPIPFNELPDAINVFPTFITCYTHEQGGLDSMAYTICRHD